MKEQMLILIILCVTSFAFAQNPIVFEKLYFSETYPYGTGARCVAQCNDGGYIIGGYSYFGWYQMKLMLLKTDSLGNEEWRNYYGAIPCHNNQIWGIEQLTDGNYVCCGSGSFTEGSGNDLAPWNSIIMSVDNAGNLLWYHEVNMGQYEKFNSLIINNNKIICAGYADEPPTKENARPIWAICNIDGNNLQTFSPEYPFQQGNKIIRGICKQNDSIFHIAGDMGNYSFIISINQFGDTLQTKTIGSGYPSQLTLYDIVYINGEIICAGLINENNIDYEHSAYYVKFDNTLNLINDYWYPFENEEEVMFCKKVLAEPNGDFIIAGIIGTPDRDWEIWIKKHSYNNEILWERYMGGGPGGDELQDIIKTSDGGYVILSTSRSFSDSSVICLVKTDSMCNGNYSSPVLPINNNLTDVSVYPNPANNMCCIEFPDHLISEYIEIYSLTGVLVQKCRIENRKQILNISTLKAGLYIITDEKKSFTKKLVINN
jgi:hypothetical protein